MKQLTGHAAQAVAKMSVSERAELLRKWRNARTQLQRMKQGGSKTTESLIGLGTSLAAGGILGYLWQDSSRGPDWKPVAGIPVEYLGIAAGLVGSMYLKGRMAQVSEDLGKGFAAVTGLKLGLGMGAGKKKISVSGDYEGLDDSSGADLPDPGL